MTSPRFLVAAIVTSLCTVMLISCGGNNNNNGPDSALPTPDGTSRPKCSDGIDNDGDGKIDFPADPGCSGPNEDNEQDDCPTGPNCPQCANGKDDDANGKTDYPDDPGCTSASDNDEFSHNAAACGASMMVKQLPNGGVDTVTLDAASTSTVMSPCGGGAGSLAVAYEIHVTSPTTISATTVDTATTADTVLDLRGAACSSADSELVCNDDVSTSVTASTINRSVPPGVYYLVVEGHDSSVTGTFVLHTTLLGGEGSACMTGTDCGAGLVCRIPAGETHMLCEKPMCSDGVDDDGDNKIDYPNDPGCTSADDNDETDDCPSGPNCPQCGNGIDDDHDGMTDYPADTSCTSASGNSEACSGEQDPIGAITMGTTTGTLVGAHDDHQVSCVSNTGPDLIYMLTVPALRTLSIDTNTSMGDTVLSLLPSTCAQPSLACNDDGGTTTHASAFTLPNVAAGTYYVEVDSYNSSTPSPFVVHVSGVIAPGTSCEPAVTMGGAFACAAANPCTGTVGSRICQPAACSDGIDNDGDGKIDYPNDPGCSSPDDTDEADDCPNGPNCPQCGNHIDDDADGLIDYPSDPDCTSASDNSERICGMEQDAIVAITSGALTGTLVGAHDDHDPSCGGNGGPDRLYTLTIPAVASLTLDTELSTVDTILSLMTMTCAEPSLACDDDGGVSTGASLLTFTNLAAGTYVVAVDAYSSNTTPNTYNLNVAGVLNQGASCEPAATLGGALTCPAAHPCMGTVGSRTCQ